MAKSQKKKRDLKKKPLKTLKEKRQVKKDKKNKNDDLITSINPTN